MSSTVEVRSTVAGKHLVLHPTWEEHDHDGRRRILKRGTILKFVNGRAMLPEELVDDFKSHPEYGRSLYLAADHGAPGIRSVPVVDGAMSSAERPVPAEEPNVGPIDSWDDAHTKDILDAIDQGALDGKLMEAAAWEFSHRNRSQVVNKLSARMRNTNGAPDAGEEE